MQVQHLGQVLGFAKHELLAVRVSDLRGRLHQDPGFRAIDSGAPRAPQADEQAVFVAPRDFAEIPDIALQVLGHEIVRVLDHLAGFQVRSNVVHDAALHAGDLDRLVGHVHDHLLAGLLVAVHIARSRLQGQVGIDCDRPADVIGIDELRGVDTRVVGRRAQGSADLLPGSEHIAAFLERFLLRRPGLLPAGLDPARIAEIGADADVDPVVVRRFVDTGVAPGARCNGTGVLSGRLGRFAREQGTGQQDGADGKRERNPVRS